MKQGRFPLLAALLLFAPGCLGGAQNTQLLERDLRWQEDEIYYLQDQLDEKEQQIWSLRHENASLKRDLGMTDGGSYNPRKDLPPATNGRGSGRNNGPELQLPSVELPGTPSTTPPPRARSNDSSSFGPALGPPVVTPASLVSREDLPADALITHIEFNKLLTGGHNVDGRAGDDGILVVFQPLNAAGQVVPIAGETSIVLLDPTVGGEAARIARWDFPTDEVLTHYNKLRINKGFEFDLRWTNRPPRNPNLRLYVRFITPEGKRLVAEKDIKLRLLGSEDKANYVRDDEPAGNGNHDARAAVRPPLTAQRPDASSDPSPPSWKPFRNN